MVDKKEVKDILRKYEERFGREVGRPDYIKPTKTVSREYEIFREEALEGDVTFYEKLCNFTENIVRINPSAEEREKLEESINVSHLNITPSGAVSFSVFACSILILLGIFIGVFTFVLGQVKLFLPFVLMIGGALLIKPVAGLPHHF